MSVDTRPTPHVPRANPVARFVAIVIGLALLVLAVICGREIWLRNSRSIDWDTWVDPIVMTIGNATYQPWMLPTGAAFLVLGALLVWAAFRPRTRTHRMLRPVDAATSVWMRPVDIARMLGAAARAVPGVATAAARVSGSTAHVSVTGHHPDLAPLVDAALQPLITRLGLEVTLKVRQRPLEEEQ
ncbi:MAG: DUF6286 domain-containing protein [Corynebacterium sp.]|uniref:DUF6286 domain-containing protein n=1 Tax=Corynebacterium sp. TaxID=1720 RepID=UPI0026E08E0B|nr:DUF6286 domain-containing protein [Corynebacterium sp.]MDO5671170.1 DUF6286 domain-containing protein [Corynebacterium sp.]